MNEENKKKLKEIFKNYLEKNDMYLQYEIWNSSYSFKKNNPLKEKKETSEHQIESFIKEYSLGTDENSNNYKFWKYVCQKDVQLAHEIVIEYVKYPVKDYMREEYIEKIFKLYTKNKKENKLLWSIISSKTFLNNNIKEIDKLFNEEVLSNIQKKEIVEYYINLSNKSAKFNTLENKRILTLLNEKLLKPIDIELIKGKDLNIQTRTEKCIYFEVNIKDLIEYSLTLSTDFSENLLRQFHYLLPKVNEAETIDVIPRKIEEQQQLQGYGYAVLTQLSEDLIKKIFTNFVDSYIETIKQENKIPSKEESLDCLRFAVIKARKEKLENQFTPKNLKEKLNKI